MRRLILLLTVACVTPALAGNQQYEPLSVDVQMEMTAAIADDSTPYLAFNPDSPSPYVAFDTKEEARAWLDAMSPNLVRRMPDQRKREEFLLTVHYESTRAGLDPQLVLGLIQVESAFRKYAVSSAGARGLMQVMPFWVKLIGKPQHNLFHLRTNLRYGCAILKLYLKLEKGDYYRALGRYNGSLGKPEYPNMVLHAWHGNWNYTPRPKAR